MLLYWILGSLDIEASGFEVNPSELERADLCMSGGIEGGKVEIAGGLAAKVRHLSSLVIYLRETTTFNPHTYRIKVERTH